VKVANIEVALIPPWAVVRNCVVYLVINLTEYFLGLKKLSEYLKGHSMRSSTVSRFFEPALVRMSFAYFVAGIRMTTALLNYATIKHMSLPSLLMHLYLLDTISRAHDQSKQLW